MKDFIVFVLVVRGSIICASCCKALGCLQGLGCCCSISVAVAAAESQSLLQMPRATN